MEVFEILKKNSKLCEEKSRQYVNTYVKFGTVMDALHPEGIALSSKSDFEIFGVWMMVIHKLTRISEKLFDKNISMDSITDLSVYAAMLEKIIIDKERKAESETV